MSARLSWNHAKKLQEDADKLLYDMAQNTRNQAKENSKLAKQLERATQKLRNEDFRNTQKNKHFINDIDEMEKAFRDLPPISYKKSKSPNKPPPKPPKPSSRKGGKSKTKKIKDRQTKRKNKKC